MKTTSRTIFFFGIFLCIIGFTSIAYADSLAQRLAGRILLQTESKGEAWYVNPVNKQRYYLNSPEQCFAVLRKLSLGITNKNLSQIPIAKDSPTVTANNTSKTSEQTTVSTGSSQTQSEKKSIGEEIQNKTFKFKVNSAEEKSSISGTFGIMTPRDNAKFIVINMSITNTTNSKYMFWPEKSFTNEEGFFLLDEKGRQYETYDNTIGYMDNYLNQRYLSPSLAEMGSLVYEIPNDAGNIGFVTQNANTGVYYVVALNY